MVLAKSTALLNNGKEMKCPRCGSEQIRKNGHRSGKQNYLCKNCNRQFVESYSQRGYSDDAKQICLKMHHNGLGFREIERLTGISHNTIINWARQAGLSPDDSEINELKEDTKIYEIREPLISLHSYQSAVFA
jgi:transposase-like protein